MKVAMLVPGIGPCGIHDYTLRLQNRFPGQMDLFHATCFEAGDHDLLHVQFEPTLFRLGRKSLFPALMRKNHRLKKVVTVHEAYEVNPFIAPRPSVTGLLGFLKRAKYDFLHGLERLEESFARHDFYADAVIVHTVYAKALLARKGCSPEKIHVLPHPVFDHPPPQGTPLGWKNISEGKKMLLVFGFISPAVDYAAVLRAMRSLQTRCCLVIAGGARRPEDRPLEADLDELIRKEGLAEAVQRIPYVPEDCLSFLFRRADVFISASRFKTSSGSLAHALGECLPAVASDLPYIREINAEVNCLKTYRPGDAEDLAAKILELLDPGTHAEVQKRLRQYADLHSLARFAESHASIYRGLLEGCH
jgi:glycosyltransferase involved in cell wall biosynthesis